MKKFFSLVLALVMALSLTTVAWGATTYPANDATSLASAVSSAVAGDTIKLGADITIADGITVTPGVIIDGADYTLTVTGEGGMAADTTEAAIFSTGAISVKNLTIVGGSRGIYINGTLATDIVIDNVEIVNSCRAINVTSSGANAAMTISNSTLAGKISYQENVTPVTFENCEFVINASVKGNVVEPYSATTFDSCVFEDTFVLSLDDFDNAAADATVELENCTYDGDPITAANVDDLFTNVGTFDLATVAPATFTGVAYNVYDANGNLVVANTTYTENDGTPVNQYGVGEVEYYTIADMAGKFVELSKAEKADADYYVTLVGQSGAIMYLKEVKNTVYTVAKKMTDIGTACDQLNVNNKYDYYYTTDLDGVKTYYKGVKDTAGSAALLVAGELVQVEALGYGVNAHVWQIETIKDHEVTAISCKVCGDVYNVYENKLAAPAGAILDPVYGYIAPAAPAAPSTPSTDKVTSADTFDAGIAMYVGMSIMAAAGGAVVIGKKKD